MNTNCTSNVKYVVESTRGPPLPAGNDGSQYSYVHDTTVSMVLTCQHLTFRPCQGRLVLLKYIRT